MTHSIQDLGLPRWLCGKESACQCRRRRFESWVGKIPWSRKWQPTPVFLPGKFNGQKNLAGYSHMSPQSRTRLSNWACTHTYQDYTYNLRVSVSLSIHWFWQFITYSNLQYNLPLIKNIPSLTSDKHFVIITKELFFVKKTTMYPCKILFKPSLWTSIYLIILS